MYFYKLMGGGYESSNETTYYSDKKYTQEEFEDIVFDCFKTFCERMVKDKPISLCYPDTHFNFDDIIWDYKGIFRKLMAEKGFHHLSEKLTAYMFFDLTDGFFRKIYKDVDNSYHNRANKIINDLDIDESCWENCSILEEEYKNDSHIDIEEEKEYCREDCIVCYRKDNNKQFSL